jgi:DME family drug/metabolite transporter
MVTAFSFGLTAVLVRKGLSESTAVTATFVISGVQVVVLSLLLVLSPPSLSWVAVGYFVVAGLLAATMGRTLNYMSIDRLGVPISTSLSGTNPLFTIVFASILIGEAVEVSTVAGTVLVVAGIALISGWGGENGVNKRDLVIPLTAASFYALSSIVRKTALNMLPEPVLGAVVGALASLVTYPLVLRLMNRQGEIRLTKGSLPYFAAAGVSNSVAWITMFIATQGGSVSVVSAIIGANPLFGLLLSAVFLRSVDRITPRIIAGCLFIVAGVSAITLL